jgi:hypothetical protein
MNRRVPKIKKQERGNSGARRNGLTETLRETKNSWRGNGAFLPDVLNLCFSCALNRWPGRRGCFGRGLAHPSLQPLHILCDRARTGEQDERKQKAERRDNVHRRVQALSAKRFERLLCYFKDACGCGRAGGEEIAREPSPQRAERCARRRRAPLGCRPSPCNPTSA